ncbi:unnamed protein product [Rotaria sp. Silwood1]|nr:unnamed protein product [Rotaria sp. Silwood1]
MKSNTVAKVMSTWKSSVNIHAFVDRVDSETEHIFDDKFFERLNCVIDAVDNVATHDDDDDLKSNTCGGFEGETESKIDAILSQLPKVDELLNLKVQPHDLKLEVDFNFQLDYIVAATNLRAENYGIETVERIKLKRIAGRIIPAIVTTTTVVAGLMSLEMYKFAQGHMNIEYFKNSSVNMALPFFMFYEPLSSKRKKGTYALCNYFTK